MIFRTEVATADGAYFDIWARADEREPWSLMACGLDPEQCGEHIAEEIRHRQERNRP